MYGRGGCIIIRFLINKNFFFSFESGQIKINKFLKNKSSNLRKQDFCELSYVFKQEWKWLLLNRR